MRQNRTYIAAAALLIGFALVAWGRSSWAPDAEAGAIAAPRPLVEAAAPEEAPLPETRLAAAAPRVPGRLEDLCLDPCDLLVARGKGAPRLNPLAVMYTHPGPERDAAPGDPLSVAMASADDFEMDGGVFGGKSGAGAGGLGGRALAFLANPAGPPVNAGPSDPVPPISENPGDPAPPGGDKPVDPEPPIGEEPPPLGEEPPIDLDPPGGDYPPPLETPLPGSFALFLSAIIGSFFARRRQKA